MIQGDNEAVTGGGFFPDIRPAGRLTGDVLFSSSSSSESFTPTQQTLITTTAEEYILWICDCDLKSYTKIFQQQTLNFQCWKMFHRKNDACYSHYLAVFPTIYHQNFMEASLNIHPKIKVFKI